MIFTDDFLFLHYPKTGGMMLTGQLLRKLKGKVYYTLPKGHISSRERILQFTGKIKILEGARHENLKQASDLFKVYSLPHKIESFKKIIVIVRNPYDYMVSRFHYLKDRQKHNKEGLAAKIAAKGNFKMFAEEAPLYCPPEEFLIFNRSTLDNLLVIKYELMDTLLNQAISPFLKEEISFDRRVNSSQRKDVVDYVTDASIEKAIFKKFRYLFDHGYYERLSI